MTTVLQELGRPIVAAWLEHRNVKTLRNGDAVDLMIRVGVAIEAERQPSKCEFATTGPTDKRRIDATRRLTIPELNHLLALLETDRESGSYAGPREQYYQRTERLTEWCKEQVQRQRGSDGPNRNI